MADENAHLIFLNEVNTIMSEFGRRF